MKALVLESYNNLVYKDVADPEINSEEVLIKVMACGICGSDIHGLDGSTGRRIPPLIMGHEASGIIARAGSDVRDWKAGDRVTFDSTVYPLNDWFTLKGKYNLSDSREVLGVSPGTYRRNGAFAEYVAVPSHILYHIPEKVTFEQAAMVEAAAVALHAVNLSGIRTGDSCAVLGAGTIGTFLIKLLRIAGAGKIIAIDNDNASRDRALKAGADCTLPAEIDNLMERISEATSSRGADISFEAVGRNETFNLAVDAVRKGGKVVLIGNLSAEVNFPLQKAVTRELSIFGSCAICGEYEAILQLIERDRLMVDDQIFAVAPLSEGADWFRKLYMMNSSPGKVILIP